MDDLGFGICQQNNHAQDNEDKNNLTFPFSALALRDNGFESVAFSHGYSGIRRGNEHILRFLFFLLDIFNPLW